MSLEETGREQAVKLRKIVKRRKPKFRRHESWRYKRLSENWRKPRGLDNKMRLSRKGWPKSVKVGYGGPRASKGLHPSGFEEVRVFTPDDLGTVDPKTQAIRIAHTVGTRKRIQIASLAREMKIRILNPLVRAEVEEPEEAETEEETPTKQDEEEPEAEQPTPSKSAKARKRKRKQK